jgi:hypothetical protein
LLRFVVIVGKRAPHAPLSVAWCQREYFGAI